jgi:DNA-binding PadR family transcriptional regulator
MEPIFTTDMAPEHHDHGGRRGQRRSRHRGRRQGGPPPWRNGNPFGGPRGRAGRGDVRSAVLLLLAERPRHGYEIITEIVERSEGRWQPSPGSVYPVLKRLAADGMVEAERDGDRRVFDLTDYGRAFVEGNAETLGEPWADVSAPSDAAKDLFDAARQTAGALWQVSQSGSDRQIAEATELMKATRRALYLMLADDGDDET